MLTQTERASTVFFLIFHHTEKIIIKVILLKQAVDLCDTDLKLTNIK